MLQSSGNVNKTEVTKAQFMSGLEVSVSSLNHRKEQSKQFTVWCVITLTGHLVFYCYRRSG